MVELSIIVPAYNEENRIKPFLEELLAFCEKELSDYEILVVNDGSTDGTLALLETHFGSLKQFRIVSYTSNRGKGYAVKKGVLSAKGNKLLFIDADGSINPDQIPHFLSALQEFDVVVGDRSSSESTVVQHPLRKLTGIAFNSYVRLLFQSHVTDNLCGVKAFKKNVAEDLFSHLYSERWVFDVELFYLIKKRGYTLKRIPLVWEHKEDSKIRLFDPLKMAFTLFVLRLRLLFRGKV